MDHSNDTLTRQPTPGSSNGVLQPLNLRKRPSNSDAMDEPKDTKKFRQDTTGGPNAVNGKERKKRRKRKRKLSVVAAELERKPSSQLDLPPLKLSTKTKPSVKTLLSVNATDTEDENPILSSSDKGKSKALNNTPILSDNNNTLASQDANAPSIKLPEPSYSSQEEITRLTEQLAAQTLLLERHKTQLNHTQQSLTCQICLDLLYKPFALAPCGHIACYPCLVRWFTSPQPGNNDNNDPQDDINQLLTGPGARRGRHIQKKKTCPLCRAVVLERPVEVWVIKSMVANLTRSGIVDLPVPTPESAQEENSANNTDPWLNIFRKTPNPNRRYPGLLFRPPRQPQPENEDRNQVGMYDAEDGGVYRCLDCMHEIWGDTCTNCERVYPGHQNRVEDDDEAEDDYEIDEEEEAEIARRVRPRGGNMRRTNNDMILEMMRMLEERVDFLEEDDEDEEVSDIAPPMRHYHYDDPGDDDEDVSDIAPPIHRWNDPGDDSHSDWDEGHMQGWQQVQFIDHNVGDLGLEDIMQGRHANPWRAIGPPERFYDFSSEDEGEEEGIARVEELSEGEDEDGYESSFIDDGDGDQPARRPREVIDLNGSSEEDEDRSDDNEGEEIVASTLSRLRRMRNESPALSEDDENPIRVAGRLGRQTRFGRRRLGERPGTIVLDSSDDE